jgi:hypothetical protein
LLASERSSGLNIADSLEKIEASSLVWAAGRLFRMQSQQQRQKGGVRVSPELAEIVRSVSEADSRLPLARHIQIIEERRAQETECFLRACAVRLRLEGGI